MANYVSKVRSNYFRVKDAQAFREFISGLGLKPVSKCLNNDGEETEVEGEELYGFLDEDGEVGIPNYDPETEKDIDFPSALAKHLVDGEVAVILEVGNEKYRYLVGYALAVSSSGAIESVALNEIYDKARSLGVVRSPAEC